MASVIAVIRDLLFSTKVVVTGQALGAAVRMVTSAEALRIALAEGNTRLVIVDMGLPEPLPADAIRAAVACPNRVRVVAYYSHVEVALREAALAAGATDVMPRSQFVNALPDMIREFAFRQPDSKTSVTDPGS